MNVTTPDVTVMVTTCDGAERITGCLDSLARQTLSPTRFEILVVQNGPECATPEVVTRFARMHPRLQIRMLEMRRGGLSHARNVGLLAARGTYVTYLDDDDWFTDNYLAAMLAHASPDVVPVALVSARVEGDLDGGLDFDNYAGRNLLQWAGQTIGGDRLPTALNYNAGKLVATELARQVQYDESLRSGEDLVYWASLLALRDFALHVLTVEENAVYCRTMRPGSLGNQNSSYDFLVTQRIDCLRELEAVNANDPVSRRVVGALVRGQGDWINRYLRDQPHDHARVVEDARAAGLRRVPWGKVNRGLARCLLIRAGHLQSGDVEAVKRLVQRGVLVDVISDTDDWSALTRHVPVRRIFANRWTSPPPDLVVPETARHARAVVESWEEEQRPYESLVTVGDGPFAADLAELLLRVRPGLVWEQRGSGAAADQHVVS